MIERDHRVISMISMTVNQEHTPTVQYMSLLTPYAFDHVTGIVQVITEELNDGQMRFSLMSSNGIVEATESTCQCNAWTSMKLPCRHIFMVREKIGADLFDSGLCAVRWT